MRERARYRRAVDRALDIFSVFENAASGTMADPNNRTAVRVNCSAAGSNDVTPFARVDIEKTVADGETARNVTSRDGAVSARVISLHRASTPAKEQLQPILTLAGAKAPGEVKVKALLDAKNPA